MTETAAPITILYRGTLEDTAALVGLANTRVNIGLIAFTANLTPGMHSYLKTLDQWLVSRGFPRISIHPNMSAREINQLISDPIKEWGWRRQECGAAIYLSGLPFPPHAAESA